MVSSTGEDIFLRTNDGDVKIILDDIFVDLEELILGEKLLSLNAWPGDDDILEWSDFCLDEGDGDDIMGRDDFRLGEGWWDLLDDSNDGWCCCCCACFIFQSCLDFKDDASLDPLLRGRLSALRSSLGFSGFQGFRPKTPNSYFARFLPRLSAFWVILGFSDFRWVLSDPPSSQLSSTG